MKTGTSTILKKYCNQQKSSALTRALKSGDLMAIWRFHGDQKKTMACKRVFCRTHSSKKWLFSPSFFISIVLPSVSPRIFLLLFFYPYKYEYDAELYVLTNGKIVSCFTLGDFSKKKLLLKFWANFRGVLRIVPLAGSSRLYLFFLVNLVHLHIIVLGVEFLGEWTLEFRVRSIQTPFSRFSYLVHISDYCILSCCEWIYGNHYEFELVVHLSRCFLNLAGNDGTLQ